MVRTSGESSSGARTPGEQTPILNNDRDVIINRLTELVERQSEQIQQLIQQRDMGGQPRAEMVQPQPRVEQVEIVGERFRKLNPPMFEDALDPTAAEDWLRTLENMFHYSRVSEEEKVMCAFLCFRQY